MLRHFQFTTAGESHGKGILTVVEGFPAGVPIGSSDIADQLARRQAGHGRGGRMRIERDAGELLSGVRLGESIGSPLSVWIPNRDFANWKLAMAVEPQPEASDADLRRVTLPRPGHADPAVSSRSSA